MWRCPLYAICKKQLQRKRLSLTHRHHMYEHKSRVHNWITFPIFCLKLCIWQEEKGKVLSKWPTMCFSMLNNCVILRSGQNFLHAFTRNFINVWFWSSPFLLNNFWPFHSSLSDNSDFKRILITDTQVWSCFWGFSPEWLCWKILPINFFTFTC